MVSTNRPDPGSATLAAARLLIHATEGAGRRGIRAVLRRWRARAAGIVCDDAPGPVLLQVADLQGRPIFTANELTPLTDVRLPAGTYHVTVSQGGPPRCYTVALDPGATFDLHLRRSRAAA